MESSQSNLQALNLIQAAFTALLSVVVFVIGQLIDKIFIEPIKTQRKIIGEIAYSLIFYDNRFPISDNKGTVVNKDELIQVSSVVRDLAAQLRITLYTIPFYRLLCSIRLVVKTNSVLKASEGLIGWSNSLLSPDDRKDRQHFKKEITDMLSLDKYSI